MRQALSFILCIIFITVLLHHAACGTVPRSRKNLPGRRQQLPTKSEDGNSSSSQQSPPSQTNTPAKPSGSTQPIVIVPVLESKSYIDPGRFIRIFKDQFKVSSSSPFSFSAIQENLGKTCSFGQCSESTIRSYVSSFYKAMREKPAKAERFCHHLLANYVKDMAPIFETEEEPIIFSELWQTCARNSFYRPASYLKPARRVKIEPAVFLEPMTEYSLILPDNIFVPSELGKETVEILRFIGDSKVQFLVESMTPAIMAATARAPPEICMQLFQKLFIERPYDKKGVRFPQLEKTWSLWSWLFGNSDE